MATYGNNYRDPYGEAQYASSQPSFNPYTNNNEPHQTYPQAGYDDYNQHAPSEYPPAPHNKNNYQGQPRGHGEETGGYQDDPPFQTPPTGRPKERSVFEEDATGTPIPREKTAGTLRKHRYETRGDLWTGGSRGRCVGRFFCCTLLLFLFFLLPIIGALVLWIRPPNIAVGQIGTRSTGSPVTVQSDGIDINLGLNISVSNPNYFSVTFKTILAEIIYPIGNTNIGSGVQNNVVFKSGSQTNFTFPFSITYKTAEDPGSSILQDLASKCIGTSKSPITVDYKITLGIQILFLTISPVVRNTASFDCPISQADLTGFLSGSGLSGILGGLVSREDDEQESLIARRTVEEREL